MNGYNNTLVRKPITSNQEWSEKSTKASDCSMHQIAPYIGRMKTAMARALIEKNTNTGELVVDPFSGCGVVALEAANLNRNVIVGDWNPYAALLTKAKLFPPNDLKVAEKRFQNLWELSQKKIKDQDLRTVPQWVRKFFHSETLRNALAFRDICIEKNDYFLLSCLLGILHHQSIGFLSYPSSHLVPYLRDQKFPRESFPKLYQERDVHSRMLAKLRRTFLRPPKNFNQLRKVFLTDARKFPKVKDIKAVITSPPYMNELDYVRDNRLRLWFLQKNVPYDIELTGKNHAVFFKDLMKSVCIRLAPQIKKSGYFIFVIGNGANSSVTEKTPSYLTKKLFADEDQLKNFQLISEHLDWIPDIRRSRRTYQGTKTETIFIYKKIK